jgi:acyl-CoA synthetase (AMP-forming)/AMP-acid ligase II
MIKTKGERVSPKEIESVLHNLAEISEASVFGTADPIFGQAIVACIVTKQDAVVSEKEIKKFCTQNLEQFMVPKYIDFKKEFPKSPSGKVNKKLMSEEFA